MQVRAAKKIMLT